MYEHTRLKDTSPFPSFISAHPAPAQLRLTLWSLLWLIPLKSGELKINRAKPAKGRKQRHPLLACGLGERGRGAQRKGVRTAPIGWVRKDRRREGGGGSRTACWGGSTEVALQLDPGFAGSQWEE
jgi:hypothetical protein